MDFAECTGDDDEDEPTQVEKTDQEQYQIDAVDGIWDSDSSSVVFRTVKTPEDDSTSSCSCHLVRTV